jgi:ATP-dependent Clp protease, protease subunit
MTPYPGRRRTLLLLAGAAMPAVARAQGSPSAPQVTAPGTPPVDTPMVTPAPPTPAVPMGPTPLAPAVRTPAAPPRQPLTPIAAIDKTKSYYLFFDQIIDVASMRTLRRQLATLVEAGVSDITLVIDSGGGQVEPMLITYSFILALPAKINTHAQGFVQSAAMPLFLAGQERSADRNARFLFHPSQSPVNGVMNEDQIHERLTLFDTVTDVIDQIYHDRTRLPQSEIDRFGRETVIYTAAQALATGVVQKVADLRIPGDGKAKILFLD